MEYANKIYEPDDANAIISVISEYEVASLLSREELEAFYQGSDSSLILDYLEYSNIPLSLETFRAVQTRFHENDISFEVIEPKKVANMWINKWYNTHYINRKGVILWQKKNYGNYLKKQEKLNTI